MRQPRDSIRHQVRFTGRALTRLIEETFEDGENVA